MDRAHELRDLRTRHKAQVTAASNKLLTAIQRNKTSLELDGLVDQLEAAFATFSETHELLGEVTPHDCDNVELAQLKTVNGPSMESYYSRVETVRDKAVQAVLDYEKSLSLLRAEAIKRDATVLIDGTVPQLSSKLDEFCTNPSASRGEISVFFIEIDDGSP